MMGSLNPFDYEPAQIAKALVAALTAVVGLLGLLASTFSDGPLDVAGQWAAAAALFLTPILVFLKRAQPWMEMLHQSLPGRTPDGTAGE
ncbi:hypothetical protein NDR87_30995 [Nocardia sp. CDC159]|uniref:Uncharacterized protein n=1 Tax=Nocardia pulmonis TaxID=2951408 RepID=A0A9X2EC59_9NOCA|nr:MULTISPECIES: hypothetical protein [Nocardia]MCM6778022.1 hypothetical protein [Nocardia pulmonis]MCM6790807.1 hypothetical protein [Nocardia sp. CDC159]